MSRGAGRIEREIAALILEGRPDGAFTTEELAEHIYGTPVEKKHRVSILRAASKVYQRHDAIGCFRMNSVGGSLVYFNKYNVTSYALARMKSDSASKNDECLRAKLKDKTDRCYKSVQPGGDWWQHVQWRI